MVVRYTNVAVAAVIFFHYIITRTIALVRGEKRSPLYEISAIVMGIVLPVSVLLWYNLTVFGSPFDNGYNYSHLPIKFAFQYIGEVDLKGRAIPLQILVI